MDINLTPTKLIDQLRAWFHPKDRTVFIAEDCFIDMDEQAKPSTNPAVGRDRLYPKAGNNWYVLDSSGTETLLGGSGGLPIHDHSDNTEGGQNLHSIQELEFDNYSKLTINAGVVTRTQVYHSIDTQGGAATDDLDTINGGTEADLLITRQDNDARDIKYTDNGNLSIPAGIDLYSDLANTALGWIYNGQNWLNFANPFGRWALIGETILGAPAASVTFATIPQTFRHLSLFIAARSTAVATADSAVIRYNADAGANYDYVILFGLNALPGSVNVIAGAFGGAVVIDAANSRASCFGGGVAFIPNYTNANIEKDLYSISGNEGTPTGATKYFQAITSHWRNTAAITSITLLPVTGPNFAANSVFALYGIL